MNEEQLNFLKKFATTTKNETVYDDFVKKITDVVETKRHKQEILNKLNQNID